MHDPGCEWTGRDAKSVEVVQVSTPRRVGNIKGCLLAAAWLVLLFGQVGCAAHTALQQPPPDAPVQTVDVISTCSSRGIL